MVKVRREELVLLVKYFLLSFFIFLNSSCDDSEKTVKGESAGETPAIEEWECEISSENSSLEFLEAIGCKKDFYRLAAEPADAILSGAKSMKVVLDTVDSNRIYFQDTQLFPIHYEFVSKHLSGNNLPLVSDLATFNKTEYFSPERRFILGAISFYEEPEIWALELSPYDTAPSDMITLLYNKIKEKAFFGTGLYFHPTSDTVAKEAEKLSGDVKVTTTDDIYKGVSYQPLTLGTGVGQLRFLKATELADSYLSFKDLVVLDEAPNDISVVQGLITEEFQTPLSHVNVLSQNRQTPNMGLKGAMDNELLRALEGKIVELKAEANGWSVREVEIEEAEQFWKEHMPEPVILPPLNLEVKSLVDIEDVTPAPLDGESLVDKIKDSINTFGGKSAHYSILTRIGNVPIRKAFAVPMYFYYQFMENNGFFKRIEGFLADENFAADSAVRDEKLTKLREDMINAPVDEDFQTMLREKIEKEYPDHKIRFRTSTNSEDLYGFACAGCYESHSGNPKKWDTVLDAVKETFASAWLFRTFEERSYYGVDHKSVGMALLVHKNFPDEEANGVAITNNPYDAAGLDPAFYVNVQYGGDVEVVAPPAGVLSDQFLYYYSQPNQPTSYISHSNLVKEGDTVLTKKEIHTLGVALESIHDYFSKAYGPASGSSEWYAMDIEFKFDDEENPGEAPELFIKQARPYPGRGR